MTAETTITIIGALGGDPYLKFTPSGAAVADFSVGTNARTYDKTSNEWVDGPTTWFNCSAWRELAENVAETLTKGTRVIVQGHLVNRQYEKADGTKGWSLDVNVQAVGPDLRWATAKVTRAQRGGSGGGSYEGPTSTQRPAARPQQEDPWATPARTDTEPPF